MIRKEKRPIHKPASYCLTVRGLLLGQAFFKSLMLLFVSASSFFLYPTCMQFLQKVFHVFSCSKQNNGKNIYKTARLYYRLHMMATVVKISCSLGTLKQSRALFVFICLFFVCKQLLLNFFRGFHPLKSEIISQTFSKPCTMFNKTLENKFPITSSMYLYSQCVQHSDHCIISHTKKIFQTGQFYTL